MALCADSKHLMGKVQHDLVCFCRHSPLISEARRNKTFQLSARSEFCSWVRNFHFVGKTLKAKVNLSLIALTDFRFPKRT